MKTRFSLAACAAVLFAVSAHAQAPAGAPNGSTGKCGDGTYTSAASNKGACSAHKGVASFWGASKPAAAAPAPAAKPAAAPMPAPAAKPAMETEAPTAKAVPGGGPGMVWVNTNSHVYHCSGSRYYGKTKAGKYMTESAAKAEGDRANDNKPCTK